MDPTVPVAGVAAVPTFDAVVLDCPDPAALAGFYARLLDWPMPEVGPEADEEGGAVTLDPPRGGTAIGFHRAAGFVAPTWPEPPVQQQLHLDFHVGDIEAAHERAVALGARHLHSHAHTPTAGYRVYADPVGHPFCLCWW
ncbi:putative enzyme related to lactoylglutathione lyase [Humibacillus xanthopallidus]|uniref:Putative enzyme related to lactoylglutathione lyase n=1 Tax=Humibacillus xanthopallidus TaxID=412689 RepID=A0A543PQZ3_9MICO|nr:VOC family protein [Humibacillus xanthopallidus]TQN46481.1 putative enzyme related to lactoylglutathione lyase [Humibacillus xanthopallidus]